MKTKRFFTKGVKSGVLPGISLITCAFNKAEKGRRLF